MAVKNPIQDAMLSLYENQYATRQAQLDLERARTREQVYAKGAVRGVVSELAEIEMKKQKQQEAIAKGGQAQQPSPQAMIPQTVDVTGQTSGRDMSGALKSASEIANFVSGGGGARQTGPLAQAQPVNQQGTPAGGIFQQSGGTPQTGVPPLSPQQAVPAQPPMGAAQPTSAQTVQTIQTYTPLDEPLPRKLFRGFLNIASRRIGGGLGDALVPSPGGVQTTTRIPSSAEEADRMADEAKQEAGPLAILLREGEDKVGTKEAGEIGKRIVATVQSIQKRRSPEVAEEAVRLAGIASLALEQEERAALEKARLHEAAIAGRQQATEARREAQPEEKAQDLENEILLGISRGKAPTPDQRAFLQERARMNPILRMEQNVLEATRGMSPGSSTQPQTRMPTPEDVNAAYDALGDDATPDAVRAWLRQNRGAP